MIAHKDILAVHATIIFPPAFRLLNGFAFGVVVAGVRYLMLCQICQYFLLSFHVLGLVVLVGLVCLVVLEFYDYFAQYFAHRWVWEDYLFKLTYGISHAHSEASCCHKL